MISNGYFAFDDQQAENMVIFFSKAGFDLYKFSHFLQAK
jgi:hypothetical protein